MRTFSDCYIVMLTARTEEIDKLIGLSVGADDYLTKPFSPRELLARIHAMLRRSRASSASGQPSHEGPPRVFGVLSIDVAGREVHLGGEAVALTRTEFDVLDALSARPKLVFSRRQLIDVVWDQAWVGDEHLVDVHVAHLRRNLGDIRARPDMCARYAASATAWARAHEAASWCAHPSRAWPGRSPIASPDAGSAGWNPYGMAGCRHRRSIGVPRAPRQGQRRIHA